MNELGKNYCKCCGYTLPNWRTDREFCSAQCQSEYTRDQKYSMMIVALRRIADKFEQRQNAPDPNDKAYLIQMGRIAKNAISELEKT